LNTQTVLSQKCVAVCRSITTFLSLNFVLNRRRRRTNWRCAVGCGLDAVRRACLSNRRRRLSALQCLHSAVSSWSGHWRCLFLLHGYTRPASHARHNARRYRRGRVWIVRSGERCIHAESATTDNPPITRHQHLRAVTARVSGSDVN